MVKNFKELTRRNSLETLPGGKDIAVVGRLVEDIFALSLDEKRGGTIVHPSRRALPVGFNRAGETVKVKHLMWSGEVAP